MGKFIIYNRNDEHHDIKQHLKNPDTLPSVGHIPVFDLMIINMQIHQRKNKQYDCVKDFQLVKWHDIKKAKDAKCKCYGKIRPFYNLVQLFICSEIPFQPQIVHKTKQQHVFRHIGYPVPEVHICKEYEKSALHGKKKHGKTKDHTYKGNPKPELRPASTLYKKSLEAHHRYGKHNDGSNKSGGSCNPVVGSRFRRRQYGSAFKIHGGIMVIFGNVHSYPTSRRIVRKCKINVDPSYHFTGSCAVMIIFVNDAALFILYTNHTSIYRKNKIAPVLFKHIRNIYGIDCVIIAFFKEYSRCGNVILPQKIRHQKYNNKINPAEYNCKPFKLRVIIYNRPESSTVFVHGAIIPHLHRFL